MPPEPSYHSDPTALADAIIERTGGAIVMAIPLGLGKPNHIVNALVARATANPSIGLKIITALTLEQPSLSNEWDSRFLGPALQRLFGNYPPLTYAAALRDGSLPANIEVAEFFFLAGRWLGVPRAQQSYVCANYTDALGYILDRGVNVVAQLVAKRNTGNIDASAQYSLSCNPDLTPDLIEARREGHADFILAGQVNSELPFMSGAAAVGVHEFDFMLDSPATDFELFSTPKRPVSLADHAIGLHCAGLIRDSGTLQIGIGSIGDAVAYGVLLRHQRNDDFVRLTRSIRVSDAPAGSEMTPFDAGLYGASEMLVDGFLALEAAGILKRRVDGAVVHAGFFLGPRDFYTALRDMTEERRARFAMMPVSFTNTLYGGVTQRRQARVHARFINSAMMATLLGAVISDGTEEGQAVSGVGGQFDFVQQAFALDGARSVITLNATRRTRGAVVSNIVWSYGHTTVPRQLRDVVVTEYGVAELRGRSDAEVVAAMLSVADSRFQDALLDSAKAAGKIDTAYRIPAEFRDNTPTRIQRALGAAKLEGLLPSFPFGTDFTDDEQRLLPALELLKQASASRFALARYALRGGLADRPSELHERALGRMRLSPASGPKEYLYRWLLHAALLES